MGFIWMAWIPHTCWAPGEILTTSGTARMHTLSLVTTQLQSSGRKINKKGQKRAYQSQEIKSSFFFCLAGVTLLQTL